MKRMLRRAALAALIACSGFVAAATSARSQSAHRSGCHAAHSCPSDHHTYVWTDPRNGKSWDCARPGADEYDSSRDTTAITWEGLPYFCRAAEGSPATTTTSPLPGACGVERWTVKTLQDRPVLLPVQRVTVGYLTGRPAPAQLPTTRLPFERHVFKVTAAVTLIRHEKDSDLHLVLRAGGDHMIAEAPSPGCTTRATPARRKQMAGARSAAKLCTRADVTGVAFFDYDHGQTGVAPNAIELHPILGFRCLVS